MFSKEMAGSLEMWSSLVNANQYVEIVIPQSDLTETVYVGQKSEKGYTVWVEQEVLDSLATQYCKLRTAVMKDRKSCEWSVHARILSTIPTPAGTRFIFGDVFDELEPTVENAIAVLEWAAEMERRNAQAKV